MKIISTREFRNSTKTYLDLAEKERVVLKRGDKFVNFVVTNDPNAKFYSEAWIKEFLAIPEAYRCDPFEISSSGDLFWADKRNVEQLKERLNETDPESNVVLRTKEELKSFLDSL